MMVFVWNVLFNSLYMTALCGAFLMGYVLFRKRYRAGWRYGSWILLLTGFFLPVLLRFPGDLQSASRQGGMTLPSMEVKAPQLDDNWGKILLGIWLLGMGFSLIKLLWEQSRFLSQVGRLSYPLENEREFLCLKRIGDKLGIRQTVCMKRMAGIASPILTGFFHPVIYLPEASYSEDELMLLLRHELIHVKRKDVWFQAFFCLCRLIHWFNPFLPAFIRMAEKECELSCDMKVTEGLSEEQRKVYCSLLLKSAEGVVIKPVLAARFFRNKKELMERMEEILEKPKTGKSMGIWFMLVITILFLGNIKVSAMERQFRTSPSEDRSEEIKGVGMRVERFEEGTAVYFEEGDLP